ncbi:MAG: hypothetical protein QOF58_3327 [Pseudonocardiales bacterium]|nr:hypothetical protein [Pseudonocardiales bacterium]
MTHLRSASLKAERETRRTAAATGLPLAFFLMRGAFLNLRFMKAPLINHSTPDMSFRIAGAATASATPSTTAAPPSVKKYADGLVV